MGRILLDILADMLNVATPPSTQLLWRQLRPSLSIFEFQAGTSFQLLIGENETGHLKETESIDHAVVTGDGGDPVVNGTKGQDERR